MRVAMANLPGVDAERLTSSFNRRVVTLILRAGNAITLEDVRARIRAKHFEPLDADICAKGALDFAGGRAHLMMSNPSRRYRLIADARLDLRSMNGASVVVCGRVPPPDRREKIEDPFSINVRTIEPASH